MEAGYFNDVKDAAGPAVQCIGQRLKKGLESLMAVHYNHTQRSIERTVGSAPGAKQYRRRSKWCLYIYICVHVPCKTSNIYFYSTRNH